MPENALREVRQLVPALPTRDGAGVSIIRAIGQPGLTMVDPFLLLDEIRSETADEYIAGFPPHPHRGFDTVTYMVDGRMRHRDSTGNEGVISSGGVQWMRAARGIIHSETPEQESGPLWGYQLWVNLPAAHKMDVPDYRDIDAQEIPAVVPPGGGTVKVLAGRLFGARGPLVNELVDLQFYDVALAAGGELTVPIEEPLRGAVYVTEGTVEIGSNSVAVAPRQTAVFGPGRTLRMAGLTASARLLVIAGRPLGEPVARHGPFVMNTRAEIERAIEDFQAGRLTA